MGVIFWDDKLTNSPSWNRLVGYAEWTEFYEIDQMKKMKVFLIYLFIYLFIFMQYLSLSWLGRKKNGRVDGNFSILELLDISIVNKIKGMQENADIVESDLG